MARTLDGDRLTQLYRSEQLALRARSLRELVTLYRAVDVTNLSSTIGIFARAAAILAGRDARQSGALAGLYYRLFRQAEGVPGPAVAPIAEPPPTEELAGELRGAALAGIIGARRQGFTVPQATQRGLITVSGAMVKRILAAGNMTIVEAVKRDPHALGWARVTSGDPCAFCRMLASRGPIYKTERSADFQTHDNCACTTEVVYEGSSILDQAGEYLDQWDQAQAWARESGTMSSGTSNNALNNFRRYLNAGGATAGVSPGTE